MDLQDEPFCDHEDFDSETSEDDIGFSIEVHDEKTHKKSTDIDDYPYEVLSTEDIVQHMADCIKKIKGVVEVSRYYFYNIIYVTMCIWLNESLTVLEFSL